jgi:hypothetical protein
MFRACAEPHLVEPRFTPLHFSCVDDDLFKYMMAVNSEVTKFVHAVSANTRRASLLDTLTVFITNENNTTPQRSEQREVAQCAADRMIRFFLAKTDKKILSDLTGDPSGLMTRCWTCPRLQLDIPNKLFLEGTLFPFYDFPLPRPPVATTKQRAVSDPHKKLCVHFVGLFNERWVENTTPEFDPILRCGACDKRMRCK